MIRRHVAISTIATLTGIVAFALAVAAPLAQADAGSFIGRFHTVSTIVSTIPPTGISIRMARWWFRERSANWCEAMFS